MTTPAWKLLIQGLESTDPLVPPEAARLLGELRNPAAVPSLCQHLRSSRHYHKNADVYALQVIGDPSVVPLLLEISETPGVWHDFFWFYNLTLRAAAALAALALDPAAPVPGLEKMLETSTPMFKVFLFHYAPVILQTGADAPALTRLRAAAVEAVFSRGGVRPAEGIRCAKALGEMDCDRSLSELESLLGYPSRYLRAEAAAQLIRRLPLRQGRERTAFLLENGEDCVQLRVRAALAAKGSSEDLHAFCAALREAVLSPVDAAGVLDAAVAVALPIPLADLRIWLRHADGPLRAAATAALEFAPGADAAAICAHMQADPDPRVRLQAAKSQLILSRRSCA